MVLLGKKAFSFLSYNADFCSNSLSCQDFFFIIQSRRIVERFCGKCLSCCKMWHIQMQYVYLSAGCAHAKLPTILNLNMYQIRNKIDICYCHIVIYSLFLFSVMETIPAFRPA